MKKKTVHLLLLFIVFLTLLASARLVWIHILAPTNTFTAKEGVIHLTSDDLQAGKAIQLNGEWEFYPNELRTPDTFHAQQIMSKNTYLSVPSKWESEGYQTGTYRLRIVIDGEFDEVGGIRLASIYSAFQLFVNGESIGTTGKVADKKEDYLMGLQPNYQFFDINQNEVELVLQVANDATYRKHGGIPKPIILGNADTIKSQQWFEVIVQSIVAAIFYPI